MSRHDTFKSDRHLALSASFPRIHRNRKPAAPRAPSVRWQFGFALALSVGLFLLALFK